MSGDKLVYPRWDEFTSLLADEYDRIGRYMHHVSDGTVSLPEIGEHEHPVWTRNEWVKSTRQEIALRSSLDEPHYNVIAMALRRWTKAVDTIAYYIDTNGTEKASAELSRDLVALGRAMSPIHSS